MHFCNWQTRPLCHSPRLSDWSMHERPTEVDDHAITQCLLFSHFGPTCLLRLPIERPQSSSWLFLSLMVRAGYACVAIIHRTLGMDYRIFNVRTDVNTCDCTRGSRYGHRKRAGTDSWPWEKNPLPNRGIEPASAAWRADALTNWATSHPPRQWNKRNSQARLWLGMQSWFGTFRLFRCMSDWGVQTANTWRHLQLFTHPRRFTFSWGGRGCRMSRPPVWNLRAVIWFHFAISCLVLLPSSVTLSVLSFSACWSILLNFFHIFFSHFFFVKR